VTIGQHIAFSPGFYTPGTNEGNRLIAHELAHVVQQHRTGGRSESYAGAEKEARQAGTDVTAGKTVAVQVSAPAGAQADELTKEDVLKLLSEVDARTATATELQNLNALQRKRDALLEQWKTARNAPPPPPPAPELTAEQKAEQKRHARKREELQKAGVTEEQVRDVDALDRSEFRAKYGFFASRRIREGAYSLSSSVLFDILPHRETDTTTYIFPSGRVGTIASERVNQVAELTPPSGTAGVLITGAEAYSYATTGKVLSAEELKHVQQLGDNLEGIAVGAAGIAQGRAANQAVTRSAEKNDTRPGVTVTRQRGWGQAARPPVQAANLPKPSIPGAGALAANDNLLPNEARSNLVPLFRQEQQEQQNEVAAAAGHDVGPGRLDAYVTSASKGRSPAAPAPITPASPTYGSTTGNVIPGSVPVRPEATNVGATATTPRPAPRFTRLPSGPPPAPQVISVKDEPLPEGIDNVTTTLKPRTGSLNDEESLRENMEAARKPVAPGHAANHLVPKKGGGRPGAVARKGLIQSGIPINDPDNGLSAPGTHVDRGTVFEPGGVPYHGTIHTEAYYREIGRRLKGVAEEAVAREILRKIEEDIKDGSFPH
jgi:hypothetical protein